MVALRKRRHVLPTNESNICRKRHKSTSTPSSARVTTSSTQLISHDSSSRTAMADAKMSDSNLSDDTEQDISSTNTTLTSEDGSPSQLSMSSGQDASRFLERRVTQSEHENEQIQNPLTSSQETNATQADTFLPLKDPTISKAALLPIEIILSIIDLTPDQKTLNNWKLVSKKCAYYADLRLWSAVHINLTEGKMDRASQTLDFLLEDDCRRTLMVRRLSVQGHIWRHTAPRIHLLLRKVNDVIASGINLDRIFLHLIYFQGEYEVTKPNLLPLLQNELSRLKSLTLVTNPNNWDKFHLIPKDGLSIHLALYQTEPSQVLRKDLSQSLFKLTSLDIQNISRERTDVVQGLLKMHRHTLRHLAASSYSVARDEILLMGFPALESFLFHTFHCNRHAPHRTTEVLTFFKLFFAQQPRLRSINVHVGDTITLAPLPLSSVFTVPLPNLLHLAIRSIIISVPDFAHLATQQPGLETLAIGLTLQETDPLDVRAHNPRRAAHREDYMRRNPTVVDIITRRLPNLRFLTMDTHSPDKLSPDHVVEFFRTPECFREFAIMCPPSFRLFASKFKGPDGRTDWRTIRITRKYRILPAAGSRGEGSSSSSQSGGGGNESSQNESSQASNLSTTASGALVPSSRIVQSSPRIETLDGQYMKAEMRGNGTVGLGERMETIMRRQEKEEDVTDLMWRDLYGMPLWFM